VSVKRVREWGALCVRLAACIALVSETMVGVSVCHRTMLVLKSVDRAGGLRPSIDDSPTDGALYVQNLIDDPGERVELRPGRRSAPPISWRH
jgi:hypothetical protein